MRDTHPLTLKGEFDCRSLVKQECESLDDNEMDELHEEVKSRQQKLGCDLR